MDYDLGLLTAEVRVFRTQFYNAVQLMCVPSAYSVRWVQGCCLQCVEVVLCISVQL